MKNVIFSLILILGLSACSNPNGLLWKISGNGLSQPSYLFGTWHGDTHLRNLSFLDSVPGFYDALNSTTLFFGEQQLMGDLPAKNNPMGKLNDMWMPTDTTYADLLNDYQIEKIDNYLKGVINAPLSQVNIKPHMVMFIIFQYLIDSEARKNMRDKLVELENSEDLTDSLFYTKRENIKAEAQIMDFNIQKIAYEKGKQIIGLDDKLSFDFSEIINSGKNLKEDADSLFAFICRLDTMNYVKILNDEAAGLRNAYRKQDIHGMYKEKMKQFNQTMDDNHSFYDEMLVKRNKNWMEIIIPQIQKEPAFIAVGAAHLGGEKGLVKLFRKAGYTVTPVQQ